MFWKYLCGIFAFSLAIGIISVSFLRLSSLTYAFSPVSAPYPVPAAGIPIINYPIAQPGSVMPGDLLWPLQAIRDRVWYFLTTGHKQRAELALFFSEERTSSGKSLFEQGNADLGTSTLTKAEKYLEKAIYEENLARGGGEDTSEFLGRAALASLKNKEIIEKNILPVAPEQARPHLVVIEDNLDKHYHEVVKRLEALGKNPPKDPFDRED